MVDPVEVTAPVSLLECTPSQGERRWRSLKAPPAVTKPNQVLVLTRTEKLTLPNETRHDLRVTTQLVTQQFEGEEFPAATMPTPDLNQPRSAGLGKRARCPEMRLNGSCYLRHVSACAEALSGRQHPAGRCRPCGGDLQIEAMVAGISSASSRAR